MQDKTNKISFQWICFYVALTKSEQAAFNSILKEVKLYCKSANVCLDLIYFPAVKGGREKAAPTWLQIQNDQIKETILPIEYWNHWSLCLDLIPLRAKHCGFTYSGHQDAVLLSHKSIIFVDHEDMSKMLANWCKNRNIHKFDCICWDTCWSGVENLLLRYVKVAKFIIGSSGYWDHLSLLSIAAFYQANTNAKQKWFAKILKDWANDPRHQISSHAINIFASLYNMKKLNALHQQILKTIHMWKLSSESLFEPNEKGYNGDSLEIILKKNGINMKPFNDFVVAFEVHQSPFLKILEPRPSKLIIFLEIPQYRTRRQICKSLYYYQQKCDL